MISVYFFFPPISLVTDILFYFYFFSMFLMFKLSRMLTNGSLRAVGYWIDVFELLVYLSGLFNYELLCSW